MIKYISVSILQKNQTENGRFGRKQTLLKLEGQKEKSGWWRKYIRTIHKLKYKLLIWKLLKWWMTKKNFSKGSFWYFMESWSFFYRLCWWWCFSQRAAILCSIHFFLHSGKEVKKVFIKLKKWNTKKKSNLNKENLRWRSLKLTTLFTKKLKSDFDVISFD